MILTAGGYCKALFLIRPSGSHGFEDMYVAYLPCLYIIVCFYPL